MDTPPTGRGDAAAATWILRGDERGDAAAATWILRGDERGDAATWIFRGDERGDAAAATWTLGRDPGAPQVYALPNTFAPAPIRGRVHGLAAAVGKVGAIVGSAGYPVLLDVGGGLKSVCLVSAVVALLSSAARLLVPAAAPAGDHPVKHQEAEPLVGGAESGSRGDKHRLC